MIFIFLFSLILQGLFVNINANNDINDIFYDSIKPILENNLRTENQKLQSINSLFWPLYIRKIEQDMENERQLKLKREREQQVYKKYLANRMSASSLLKDFQALRYYRK